MDCTCMPTVIFLSPKRKFEQFLKRKDQDTTECTSDKSADNDDKETFSATVKRSLHRLMDLSMQKINVFGV